MWRAVCRLVAWCTYAPLTGGVSAALGLANIVWAVRVRVGRPFPHESFAWGQWLWHRRPGARPGWRGLRELGTRLPPIYFLHGLPL